MWLGGNKQPDLSDRSQRGGPCLAPESGSDRDGWQTIRPVAGQASVRFSGISFPSQLAMTFWWEIRSGSLCPIHGRSVPLSSLCRPPLVCPYIRPEHQHGSRGHRRLVHTRSCQMLGTLTVFPSALHLNYLVAGTTFAQDNPSASGG